MFYVPKYRSIFLFALISCSLRAASVTISPIYVSIGPDANSSANYAGYTANALAGVQGGGVNSGGNAQTDPTAYNLAGSGSVVTVSGNSIVVTPFPSWLGVADPGGALSNEGGNMIYWSFEITGGPGNTLSLSQVAVTQSSTDALDLFGDPSQPGGVATSLYSGYNYATDDIGIQQDGTIVTSGSSTQMVNTIVVTGYSMAFDGYGFGFSGTDAQQLQQIQAAYATLGNFAINTCVYYGAPGNDSPSSCDVVNVVVPEPESWGGAALGLVLLPGVWFLRRRTLGTVERQS